eukprot:358372-Chlamydomonas_euryale.AAC.2
MQAAPLPPPPLQPPPPLPAPPLVSGAVAAPDRARGLSWPPPPPPPPPYQPVVSSDASKNAPPDAGHASTHGPSQMSTSRGLSSLSHQGPPPAGNRLPMPPSVWCGADPVPLPPPHVPPSTAASCTNASPRACASGNPQPPDPQHSATQAAHSLPPR